MITNFNIALKALSQNALRTAFIGFFVLVSLSLLYRTRHSTIADFGNYYYGSLFVKQGISASLIYENTHQFNQLIRKYEQQPFFENYAPVPPFSLLFYQPFTFLNGHSAKLIFNLVSLLLLAAALHVWLKQYVVLKIWHMLLPLVIVPVLYANIYNGQSYLFILALLLFFQLSLQSKQHLLAAFLLSVCMALKWTPAVFLIYLGFEKQWKTLGYSVLIFILLHMLVFLTTGKGVFLFYLNEALPKILMNEITDPLTSYNQSIHTYLAQVFGLKSFKTGLFSFLLYGTLFLLFLSRLSTLSSQKRFLLCFLFLFVFSKYNPSYSYIFLFPVFFLSEKTSFLSIVLIMAIAFAFIIPPHYIVSWPSVLPYLRVLLLTLTFILFCSQVRIQFNIITLSLVLLTGLPVLLLSKTSAIKQPFPSKALVYRISPQADSLCLNACYGHYDSTLKIGFTHPALKIKTLEKIISPFPNRFCDSAFLLNNSKILYLSDEEKGIGIPTLSIRDK